MITNPVKAIRAKCMDCCCGQTKEVALCTSSCPLHPFRFGKNPYRAKREYTEEQRQAMAARMRSIRLSQAPHGEERKEGVK